MIKISKSLFFKSCFVFVIFYILSLSMIMQDLRIFGNVLHLNKSSSETYDLNHATTTRTTEYDKESIYDKLIKHNFLFMLVCAIITSIVLSIFMCFHYLILFCVENFPRDRDTTKISYNVLCLSYQKIENHNDICEV